MQNNPRPDNTLIVVALEDELPSIHVPGWRVLYTGVGKINAAIAATEACLVHRPEHLINYGTAGGLRPGLRGLVRVHHLMQRDMDVRPLGFPLGHTPFDVTSHIELGGSGVTCGTGDHFVTSPPELQTDIVDMEAYALAKVCRHLGMTFHCWKYISDQANDAAPTDWATHVAHGLHAFYHEVIWPLETREA